MITVAILINGHPIAARSAYRVKNGEYKCDDGTLIKHKYADGAVELAKKLLDTIVD